MLCFYCEQEISPEESSRAIRMNACQYAHPECQDEALNAAAGAMDEK